MLQFRKSISIYLGLMLYLMIVKIVITFFPATFRSTAQAVVFQWKFLVIWTVLGLAGVYLAEITGFPEPWNNDVRNRRRILIAIALGILLGFLAILTDWVTGWTQIVAAKMGLKTIHIDFPASLLIYPGGAIIVNVIYRIFPIPLLLWLISGVLLKGRAQTKIFWILAILTSFVEPLSDLGLRKYGFLMMSSVFLEDYALNFSEAYLFRKFGFLTPILMRIVFYLLWHVLWGVVR
jgi:hypothetical protein